MASTLHEDLCKGMIFRLILVRIRNVSDKSCGENQKRPFMFSNSSPKIVPFVR